MTTISSAILVVIAAFLLGLLYCWFYLFLFKQNIEKMKRRFLLFGNSLFEKRFSEILRAFLSGNNWALHPFLRVNRLREQLEKAFDPFYRGFAFEGTGMGIGAVCSLYGGGRRFEQLVMQLSPRYIYQYYVGLGWWLQIRYGYRLDGYRKWIRQLNPRFAPILFDGVGFKTGLFHKKSGIDSISVLKRFTPIYLRVCLQGYGRSLWFQNRFCFRDAVSDIEKLPSIYGQDLFGGLGLAVAYSRFDNLSYALSAYHMVPATHQASFAQGIAFGWEARRLQHPDTWEETLDKYTSEIQGKVHLWLSHVHQAKVDAEQVDKNEFYTRWMDLTRHYIQFRRKEQIIQ